jgi:hypothetical protein
VNTMDHTDIQQELNNIWSRGGTVTLAPVDYLIKQDVTIPGDTILQGSGAATRLILSPGVSLVISGKANVRLRDMVINAAAHTARQRAVVVANCHDVTIENCWVLECGGFGVFIAGNQNTETGKIRVLNCRLSGKGNNDVIGGGPMTANSTTSEIIVSGNYVRQDCTTGSYRNAIDLVACTRTLITHNIVEGSVVLGGEKIPHVAVDVSHNLISPAINASFCQLAQLAQSDAGETDPSYSIKFTSNDITAGQIYVQGQKSTGTRSSRVLIQSNIVKGLKTNPDPSVNRGIVISHARDVLVDGNIVDGAHKAFVAGDVQQLRLGKNNHFVNYNIDIETDALTTLLSS